MTSRKLHSPTYNAALLFLIFISIASARGVESNAAAVSPLSPSVSSSSTPTPSETDRARTEYGAAKPDVKLAYGDTSDVEEPKPTTVETVPAAETLTVVPRPRTRMELSQLYQRAMHALFEDANLTAAVDAIREGASNGHGRLHWLLGVLHGNGIGVPQSDAQAILHYTFAALESVPEAHMALGHRYAEGLGVAKSCESAVAHYREAADAVAMTYDGVTSANNARHQEALDRHSTLQNEKAMYILMYHADGGTPEALLALGYIYFKGRNGMERDWGRAEKYFLDAMTKGETAAYGALGQLYATGDARAQPPIERDYAKAAGYFERGAAKQDPVSLNGMGYLHTLGYYAEKKPVPAGTPWRADFVTAATFFAQSAELGCAEGMYNLGVLKLHGRGVPQEPQAAVTLFERAASNGSVLSFWQLARHEQAKGNCMRAMQLYIHVASFASVFDPSTGPSQSSLAGAASAFTTAPLENPLTRLLEAVALAETGHQSSRWSAAQMLDAGIPLLEEDADELTADGIFARSGQPPQRAVRGSGVVWLHWRHAPSTGSSSSSSSSVMSLSSLREQGDVAETTALLSQAEALHLLQLRVLELSALAGSTQANLRLGDFYYYGESRLLGVSMSRAVLYYEVAARKNNAKALFYMGFMYQMGLGVMGSSSNVTGVVDAFWRIVRNEPVDERPQIGDEYTNAAPRERSDEMTGAVMRLYLAKRYYDRALAANPVSTRYAVALALASLNFQWWWVYFSHQPYGLWEYFRLPMPYARNTVGPIDMAATTPQQPDGDAEAQTNQDENEFISSEVNDFEEDEAVSAMQWDDVVLLISGAAMFFLLLIRHHGA